MRFIKQINVTRETLPNLKITCNQNWSATPHYNKDDRLKDILQSYDLISCSEEDEHVIRRHEENYRIEPIRSEDKFILNQQ